MTAMTPVAAAIQLAQRTLTRAGVESALDPAEAPVPGVWIKPDHLRVGTLSGRYTVRLDLHVLAPAEDTGTILTTLEETTRKVLSVIDPDGDVQLDAYVQSPQGNLPCWVIPVNLIV